MVPPVEKHTELKGGFGYQAGIGFEFRLEPDSLYYNLRLAFAYQTYMGSFDISSSSPGGSIYTNGKLNKGVLGLTFLPINIKLKNGLDLGVGAQYFYTILEKSEGVKGSWNLGNPSGAMHDIKNHSNKNILGNYLEISL